MKKNIYFITLSIVGSSLIVIFLLFLYTNQNEKIKENQSDFVNTSNKNIPKNPEMEIIERSESVPVYRSIEDLPESLRYRINQLYAARNKSLISLDDIVDNFSINNMSVPEAVAKLSNDCNVLCGIEIIPWTGSPEGLKTFRPVPVSLSVNKESPRQILEKLVALDPNFLWVENQGTVNLIMKKAYNSPFYPLNSIIPMFEVKDRPYSMVFAGEEYPALFGLPAITGYLTFGGSSRWPTEFEPQVSLNEVNKSVREIINDVGRKVKMSWSSVFCEGLSGGSWVSFQMVPTLPPPKPCGN